MSETNLDAQFTNSYIQLVRKIIDKLQNENILNKNNSSFTSTLNEIESSQENNIAKIERLITIINELKEKSENKSNINLTLVHELFILSKDTLQLLDFNKNNQQFINSIRRSITELGNSIESVNINPIIRNIRSIINGKYQNLKRNSVNKNIKIRNLTIKLSTLYKLLKNKNSNISRKNEKMATLGTNFEKQIQTLKNALSKCTAVPNQTTISTNLNKNSAIQALLSTLQKTNLSSKALQKINNATLEKYTSIVNSLINSIQKKVPANESNFVNMSIKGGYIKKKIIKEKKKKVIKGGGTVEEIALITKSYHIFKNITDLSFIVKLSALTPSEITKLFLLNETITFSHNGSVYNKKDILDILSKFLFINVTSLISNIFSSYSFDNSNHTIIGTKSTQTILGVIYSTYFKPSDLKDRYLDTLHMINLLKNCTNPSGCRNLESINVENKIVYMNIFKFIEILYNVVSIDTNPTIDAFYKNIFPSFAIHIINYNFLENKALENMTKIIDMLETNINFKNELDKLYLEKSSNHIITYLRVRCDKTNGELNAYNKRFDIQINQNNTLMNIAYNNHDFPYYKMDPNGTIILDPSLATNITKFSNYYPNASSLSQFVTAFTPKAYEYKYSIGPFNNIFPPKDGSNIVNNKNISDRLYEVMRNLKAEETERKPVFILGYGASGSGKTSSLIYFNKGATQNDKNGVLITLCNQFAQETDYKNISVKAYEYYSNPNLPSMPTSYSVSNIITKIVPQQSGSTINFTYHEKYANGADLKQFILNEDYQHTNTFIDRVSVTCKNDGITNTNGTKTTFRQYTPMGEVLIHIIDNDRYVKATPNNPNSSRSHSVIIVKFSKADGVEEANPPTLIIGDFAGVENIFACDDPLTLSGFSNARINGNRNKNKFYQVFSPAIGNVKSASVNMSGCKTYTQDTYIPADTPNIRRFNNPDYNIADINGKVNTMFRAGTTQFRTFDEIDTIINTLFGNNILLYKEIEYIILELVGENISSKNPTTITSIFQTNATAFNNMLQFLDFKPLYDTIQNMQNGEEKKKIFVKKIIGSILGDDGYLNQLSLIDDIYNYFILEIKQSGSAYAQSKLKEYWGPGITQYINKKINEVKRIYNIENINHFINNILTNQNNNIEFSFYKIKNKSTETYKLNVGTKQSPNAKNNPDGILDDLVSKIIIQSNKTSTQVYTEIKNKLNSQLLTLFDGSNHIEKMMNLFKMLDEKNINIATFKRILQYIYVMTMEYSIELYCRNVKSKQICEIRRSEGYMINGTLAETREIIKNMILDRNKNSIRIVPPFVNECLPYYCIDKECFIQSSGSSTLSNTIFNSIKETIGIEPFNKMVISIFMVFNASLLANNPPPIPYIDIYKLNRMLYKIKNNETFSFDKFKTIIQKLDDLTKYYGTKSSILRKNNIYQTFLRFKEELLNKQIVTPENIIKYIQVLENLKQLIDNNNAASSIGTLEFLDLISKYYTTKIMCKPENSRSERFNDLLQTNLTPLLTSIKGGSKKKSSKNKKNKKKKV